MQFLPRLSVPPRTPLKGDSDPRRLPGPNWTHIMKIHMKSFRKSYFVSLSADWRRFERMPRCFWGPWAINCEQGRKGAEARGAPAGSYLQLSDIDSALSVSEGLHRYIYVPLKVSGSNKLPLMFHSGVYKQFKYIIIREYTIRRLVWGNHSPLLDSIPSFV